MLAQLLEKIVRKPIVYDAVQRLAGREQNYRRLKPLLARAKGELLLDAGAGTGEIRKVLDPTTRYLWLDEDVQKLSGFRGKSGPGLAVMGDVTRLPLARASVHTILSLAVSHHLPDRKLDEMFSGFRRVCREQLIFLDALATTGSTVSDLMWRYDRGSYPRTLERLTSMLQKYFVLDEIQRYSIYHHYILCVGRPIR